ncbi:MAG: threonine-phosphate decarboxylase CobD [Cyanobacteria bacterium P01_A01_bin.123]
MSNDLSTRPTHGGNLAWAASLAGCSPDQLLDFSASISPLGPPAIAIAAIQSSLGHLTAYPDPTYGDLCEALGRHHHLPPDWILPGNGSAELLTWASRDFSGLKGVLLPTPAFGDYHRALAAFNVPLVPCPLAINRLAQDQEPGDGVLRDSLDAAIAAHPIPPKQLGLLINNPHNPIGCQFSVETLMSYIPQFGLVVIDEAFMDFLLPSQQSSLIAQVQRCPNLVILRSLTKFYSLPGLRLGYAIAHPNRLKQWQTWRDPWPVNVLAAAAAVAALQDHPFQSASWAWLSAARLGLRQALSHLPGMLPLKGTANYLLVHCNFSVPELQHYLLTHHRILIRDCLSFPELGDRYFRIAVRTPEDNKHLVAAIQAGLRQLPHLPALSSSN